MTITSTERSALEELAAVRARGGKPDELLELAEAAIDQATAAGGTLAVEAIAAELDAAAPMQLDPGDRLRLQLAARHARAIAVEAPATPRSEERVPVPSVAKTAFWVTVALVALTLVLFAAIAALGDVGASYVIVLLIGLVVLIGGLLVAVMGATGFVQSVQTGSRKGVLMSSVPCVIVLSLIALRIWLSLF